MMISHFTNSRSLAPVRNVEEVVDTEEYVSNADIFPCGTIKYGAGQCGLAATERTTLIAYDTKLLKNYIACDEDTRSEIVIPCFQKMLSEEELDSMTEVTDP